MNDIVFRIEHDVAMDEVALTPYKKPRINEPNRFEIYLNAQHVEGMVSRAEVGTNSPTWANFSISSDEGTAIGGNNTAPAPLDYLAAGIAFCFLSHVAMASRARKIRLSRAAVELRMKFSILNKAEEIERKGLSGTSDGVEMHFIVESDAPEQSVKSLYEECINACVAIQSIVKPVPFEPHLHLNGTELN